MSTDLAVIWAVVQIFWINLMLSGDNALMIALACRGLAERQRRLGIVLGALGAVALRIVFTFIVGQFLGIPFLTLAGGLFVIALAIRLPAQGSHPAEVDAQPTLTKAVLAIVAADAVMSLDNVLALAAASKGSLWLIVFGLLTSAPLVVFGAHILSSLMTRFPILVWGGAMVLGWAGGELVASDPAWTALAPQWRPAQPLLGTLASAAVLAWAFVFARQKPSLRSPAESD